MRQSLHVWKIGKEKGTHLTFKWESELNRKKVRRSQTLYSDSAVKNTITPYSREKSPTRLSIPLTFSSKKGTERAQQEKCQGSTGTGFQL